jgi:thiol-disulfide isomerase/thioredoxin
MCLSVKTTINNNNTMTKFLKLSLLAVLLLSAFSACEQGEQGGEGGETTPKELTLAADVDTITADGVEAVTFTVTYGEDVVTDAIITYDTTTLEGDSFTATEVGTYKFTATYDEQTSNTVTITVKEVNNSNTIVVVSDKAFLKNDGIDTATIAVMLGEEDVTADAEIFMNDAPFEGTTFASAELGEYQFSATYTHNLLGELTAEPVAVKVVDVDFDSSLPVVKRVAFFTWTATWCGPCFMYKTSHHNFADEFGDRLLQMNLHTDAKNEAIGAPASVRSTLTQLRSEGRFEVFGYPTGLAELSEAIGSPGYVPTEAQARAAFNKYVRIEPASAVKVASTIEGDQINVEVVAGANATHNYAIGIFLIEDHIMEIQTGATGDYDHTNVAREIGVDNIFGDSMGTMDAGEVYVKECSFAMLSKYKAENLSLLVYTLYENEAGEMVIDNTVKVPVNTTAEFNYAN